MSSSASWRAIPRTCYLQFGDVLRANIHAVEDIGAVVDWLLERCDFQPDAKSNLAVLHNRNDMINLFRANNWVSSSNDSIVSRESLLVLEYGPSCRLKWGF